MSRLFVAALVLWLGAFFVATQPITPQMAVVSSLSVIAFAWPSYRAVLRLQGRRRGIVILASLGLFALILESTALATGFPYGQFTYTELLAEKVFGLTPWTVAFAYPPLILLAYALTKLAARRYPRLGSFLPTILITALIATACDVVLDPAAVRLNFWYWSQPGFFYGVPLVNFIGWIFSSSLAAALLHWLWQKAEVGPASGADSGLLYSGLAIVWFWTSVNAWFGHWLPAAVGLGICLICVTIMRPRHGTIKI